MMLKMGWLIVLAVTLIDGGCSHQKVPTTPIRSVITFDKKQEYGKDTRWEEILLQEGYSICVDQFDRVYVTDGTHNRVLFLNANGNMVKLVGQKGQGPSDFVMPWFISIFNKSQIAVCEDLMFHSVSIHGTDGAFIRKFHTQYAPFGAWLTDANHIVYLTSGLIGKNNLKFVYKLFSENDEQCNLVKTCERKISMFFYDDTMHIPWPSGFKSNLYGEMRVSGNGFGKILVGMTDESDFELFEPGMKSKRIVHLEMPKIMHVRPYVEKMKRHILKEKYEYLFKEKHIVNEFKKLEFSIDHLPYYRCFLLDDYDRIFVFLNDDIVRSKKQAVNVYSTQGKLLRMFEFDLNDFELFLDSDTFLHSAPVAVSKRYFYFMLPALNHDGDTQSRVYRSAPEMSN